MIDRPIIVVSPDEPFGLALAAALDGVSRAITVRRGVDMRAAPVLWVIHGAELATAPTNRPVIAVLAEHELAAAVALMQTSERVVAVIAAESFDPAELRAVAIRIIGDDILGLGRVLPGAQPETVTVEDHAGKARCLAALAGFAERTGVPHSALPAIEQCVDEMVMNALYDAPVDERGHGLFTGMPTRARITWRTEQQVSVAYACAGNRFAVAVRDAFGRLDRGAVLRTLDKGLHGAEPVDRKRSGAGLGLYLMATSVHALHFHVLPGIATEVICVFDIAAPQPRLAQLSFLVQADLAGRQPTPPAHRLPTAARRTRRIVATTVIALALAAGGIAGHHVVTAPRPAQVTITTVPPGAKIALDGQPVGSAVDGSLLIPGLESRHTYRLDLLLDGYEPQHAELSLAAGDNAETYTLAALARLELDSQPSGALIAIDGKPIGTAPQAVTSLVSGSAVTVSFARPGYRTATVHLDVPARGAVKQLVQPLDAAPGLVAVRFVSEPPGAAIVPTGQAVGPDRTYTPAVLVLPAGEPARFTLVMPGHAPLVIEPFTPEPGSVKGGPLR